jgi:hypothetical protein
MSNVEIYVGKFDELLTKATFGQVEQAATWYLDAEKVADEVARNLGSTLEVGASVVSAFSPRERWSLNVAKAIKFSLGETVVALGNNIRMANASLELGFDALKGLKTNAFAKAIAGNANAVVVDVWMMRAAGFVDKLSPTQKQYFEIEKAVRIVSEKHAMTPRAMQALLWVIVRGSAS